jgi:hypothetical protein
MKNFTVMARFSISPRILERRRGLRREASRLLRRADRRIAAERPWFTTTTMYDAIVAAVGRGMEHLDTAPTNDAELTRAIFTIINRRQH